MDGHIVYPRVRRLRFRRGGRGPRSGDGGRGGGGRSGRGAGQGQRERRDADMAMSTNRPSHVCDVDITPTHMSDGAMVTTRGCGNTMRNWHLLFFFSFTLWNGVLRCVEMTTKVDGVSRAGNGDARCGDGREADPIYSENAGSDGREVGGGRRAEAGPRAACKETGLGETICTRHSKYSETKPRMGNALGAKGGVYTGKRVLGASWLSTFSVGERMAHKKRKCRIWGGKQGQYWSYNICLKQTNKVIFYTRLGSGTNDTRPAMSLLERAAWSIVPRSGCSNSG
jgi:hypothetical protein